MNSKISPVYFEYSRFHLPSGIVQKEVGMFNSVNQAMYKCNEWNCYGRDYKYTMDKQIFEVTRNDLVIDHTK